jgi:hypothetical protein
MRRVLLPLPIAFLLLAGGAAPALWGFAPPPTLTAPTVTPFSVNPPSGGSGGGAPKKADYSCDVIHARPFDNSEFNPGEDFDIKWTILNTGKKTWPAGYDLKYWSGPNMALSGATVVELPEMKPDDQFDVVFDAKAWLKKVFRL